MKTKRNYLVPFFLLIFLICGYGTSHSTTHTIEVSSFMFSPSSLSVLVGDTVMFQWIDGNHTTTCDGSTGTSRPAGADPWDEFMDDTHTTFFYPVTVAGTYNYKCIPHFPTMVGTFDATVSSITQTSTSLPEKFSLNQNYPNPFNPSTNIAFDIANAGFVKITIYNSLGKEVETLVNENLTPGSYQVDWNAAKVTSGVYFYRLESRDFVATKKMLLVK